MVVHVPDFATPSQQPCIDGLSLNSSGVKAQQTSLRSATALVRQLRQQCAFRSCRRHSPQKPILQTFEDLGDFSGVRRRGTAALLAQRLFRIAACESRWR